MEFLRSVRLGCFILQIIAVCATALETAEYKKNTRSLLPDIEILSSTSTSLGAQYFYHFTYSQIYNIYNYNRFAMTS